MHCVVCKTFAMYTVNFSCTRCFGETFSPTTAAAAATANTIATTGITCTIFNFFKGPSSSLRE